MKIEMLFLCIERNPNILVKAVTKKEGPKNFLFAPKMVSFSQLPAVKKDNFLLQLEKFSALLIL